MLDRITNHVDLGLGRLREQFKRKTLIRGLFTAFLKQIQGAEDATYQLNTMRTLSTATGLVLDQIGTVVGVARTPGQSDADYRVVLKVKQLQNVAQGQPSIAMQVLKILTGSSVIVYQDLYPAAVQMGGDGYFGSQAMVNTLYRQVHAVLPAGVRCDDLVSFASDGFSIYDSNDGFGFGDDLDVAVGGEIAEHLFNTNIQFAFDGSDTSAGGFGDNADALVGGVLL